MIRILLALSLLLGGAAQADSLKESVPNITVTGEAAEDVAPDRAVLRFGVVTERPTAAAAMEENARTMTAILADLKEFGVKDADMQTQGVSVGPITTEERDPKGKSRSVQNYRANNSLSVNVAPIEKAGDVIGRVVARGANSVDGVEYEASDLTDKRDALRARAVKDAERRARAYAEAAGLRLARVIEIRPLDDRGPMPMMEARVAASPASVPLRPGAQRVVERVSITWALGR